MEIYSLIRSHRITPASALELKSFALGMADICQNPFATVESLQDKMLNGITCRGCGDIFTGPVHRSEHSNDPFCCTSCASDFDDWYMEIANESKY